MMTGASGYDREFLDAMEFVVKECGINFVLKNEQAEAIHSIVTERDVSVKAATRFGKSICYVLFVPTFATIFIGQQQLEVAVVVL